MARCRGLGVRLQLALQVARWLDLPVERQLDLLSHRLFEYTSILALYYAQSVCWLRCHTGADAFNAGPNFIALHMSSKILKMERRIQKMNMDVDPGKYQQI